MLHFSLQVEISRLKCPLIVIYLVNAFVPRPSKSTSTSTFLSGSAGPSHLPRRQGLEHWHWLLMDARNILEAFLEDTHTKVIWQPSYKDMCSPPRLGLDDEETRRR